MRLRMQKMPATRVAVHHSHHDYVGAEAMASLTMLQKGSVKNALALMQLQWLATPHEGQWLQRLQLQLV